MSNIPTRNLATEKLLDEISDRARREIQLVDSGEPFASRHCYSLVRLLNRVHDTISKADVLLRRHGVDFEPKTERTPWS